MILWIVFAAMAAGAAGAVLYALRPGGRVALADSRPDLAVYQDQLAALDREVETGLIGAGEAEPTRVEISRRLLAASKANDDSIPATGNAANRRILAIACSLA
ncbi:MAG: c-type cytochrome biogenesis protein CcmI, partial [Fimbriimonadaceae bacterium]|nr:c-type cytochrome biogenesis protein CcmI [Alphaproteobacteria bacterium]